MTSLFAGNPDWSVCIDREPMMKISVLAARLATEKMYEECVALDAGLPSESEIMYRADISTAHTRCKARIVRLIGKGILTGAVAPQRGNVNAIDAYLTEYEYNQALLLRKKFDAAFNPANNEWQAHTDSQDTVTLDPKQAERLRQFHQSFPAPIPSHPAFDSDEKSSFVPIPATLRVDNSLEIDLFLEVGDIEVIPAQTVRWMLQTNEGDKLLPQSLKKYLHGEIHTSEARPMAQGGSNPETDKISATHVACAKIVDSIAQGHHTDKNNKIGKAEFVELVENSMKAQDNANMYQVTAARAFFSTSEKLKPFKRQRGKKKAK